MREIKFRACFVDTKRMIHWEQLSREFQMGELNGIPNCVFMQYTGLKDKNGKEIYEGDILIDHNWGQQERYWGVVVYQIAEFVVRYHGIKNKTWQELTCLADGNCDHWGILGNIYENAELLKA